MRRTGFYETPFRHGTGVIIPRGLCFCRLCLLRTDCPTNVYGNNRVWSLKEPVIAWINGQGHRKCGPEMEWDIIEV